MITTWGSIRSWSIHGFGIGASSVLASLVLCFSDVCAEAEGAGLKQRAYSVLMMSLLAMNAIATHVANGMQCQVAARLRQMVIKRI